MLKDLGTTPLEDRGLCVETAAEMGLRFENGKFVIEYRKDDELSFRKFKTLDRKYWIEPAGVDLHLWQIDSLRELFDQMKIAGARPVEPLIITEGEPDSVAVRQSCAGVYVTSVPNGAHGQKGKGDIYPAQDSGFRYLWGKNGKLLPEIDQFDKIILAVDNDEAGEILRDELAVRLGRNRCWFVTYPEGCKDANDVVKQYGDETLAKVIAKAEPIEPGWLVTPDKLPPEVKTKTYSTGWPFLNKQIMLVRPELFVITGAPGAGKTQWARALTFHLAETHGWKIAYLTPEDPTHRLKRDMIRFANRNGRRYENDEWINRHFYVSQVPEDVTLTMDIVFREMETAAFHHDCQAFLWDPWNEVYHDYGRLTEAQYTERTLMEVKRKSRRLNMSTLIVAHPRKLEEGQKASLYAINGASAWRNKADHGVIIHRSNPTSKVVSAIAEKCKDHETMGRPGEVLMRFQESACDYDLYTPPEAPQKPKGKDKKTLEEIE